MRRVDYKYNTLSGITASMDGLYLIGGHWLAEDNSELLARLRAGFRRDTSKPLSTEAAAAEAVEKLHVPYAGSILEKKRIAVAPSARCLPEHKRRMRESIAQSK